MLESPAAGESPAALVVPTAPVIEDVELDGSGWTDCKSVLLLATPLACPSDGGEPVAAATRLRAAGVPAAASAAGATTTPLVEVACKVWPCATSGASATVAVLVAISAPPGAVAAGSVTVTG